jgi:putative transposase
MAKENPTWSYRRIQGALANLGHHIDKITVRNILHRHHIDPAPTRRQAGIGWSQFLKMHWDVLAATDFFTVEVATWYGIVTFYVLVVIELNTRRVHLAGISPNPDEAFMMQCARQVTIPSTGFCWASAISFMTGTANSARRSTSFCATAAWSRSSYRPDLQT